ncbi:MAG: Asp23/Gls24 family envelope stress response protein [Negativicoccus succinicivorans]|nr:Asp23/Gls24 family envelope stress response protein [Negativicoccus succinicivorans]MBB6477192.1 putative alkaline shock family protein YloU [Negativicoccus succinicivorans]MBS5890011.1 Asp23/Gls24 family envelope stress response protein [Negativicoccus succinicivorans]MBS5916898.1 Asp23/Gls24 family envelope stress response protein [Negativicoccus succinicivorans]MDU0986891.1 Asp23/Gls24 family envelope stress response protein [Negativicoccus succinicivorans]MDU1055872.1 Asp23/Gls24 family
MAPNNKTTDVNMQLAYNLMAMKIRDRIMAEPGVAAITEHMMDEFMTSLPMSRRKLIHGIVLSKHKDGWYIAVSLILYYGYEIIPLCRKLQSEIIQKWKEEEGITIKEIQIYIETVVNEEPI